jgi:UDP-glucose 4-epimerase
VNEDRVVLTGASGMLGRAILRELARDGGTPTMAIYRRQPSAAATNNIMSYVVDFAQNNEWSELLKHFRPTVIIHTAATGMQQPRPDEQSLFDLNVALPVKLARVAAEIPGCVFVQLSSGLAYKDQGRPLTEDDRLVTAHPYGASKIGAERELRRLSMDRGFPLTIVRPFSFTGIGDFGSRLFPSLLRSAAEHRPFAMSKGDQVRDHSSVNDIARGVLAAACKRESSSEPQIYNLGSGDTRSVRELVGAVVEELHVDVEIQAGAIPSSPDEPMFAVSDCQRAKTELNWNPEETVAKAVWQLARDSFPSLPLNEPAR